VLGAVAVAALILTLYVRYDVGIERLSYTVLVIATLLNQNLFLNFLNETVSGQARAIEALNRDLQRKVASQGDEIGRLARLKQFLPAHVAEVVVSDEKQQLLGTHRRYIACLFCDIRDFTAFSEAADPEEVIALLQAFHDRLGGLVAERGATIGYRAGDGLMAFLNDPIPCEAPSLRAIELALDMRAAFEDIRRLWGRIGRPIGFGIGVASGYATLGLVGYQGGADYTAIGNAVNLAARLCDAAADGQILLAQRTYVDVEAQVDVERLAPLALKGLHKPEEAYRLLGPRGAG